MSFSASADDYDYHLPAANIAQSPAVERSAAKLFVDQGAGVEPRHLTMANVPDLLGPGDVVVLNDTKVLPARLRVRRPTGGAAEILLLEPVADGRWQALVRPSKKIAPGTRIEVAAGFAVVVGARIDGGRRLVELEAEGSVEAALEAAGELPLPPYITETVADMSRYQTVYATHPGSVAAPTAGLHLTDQILAEIEERGAQIARVQLTVGLDTFRPLGDGLLDEHQMHSEAYRVPQKTWDLVESADRVVAVGTTVVRSLESAAAHGALEGRTDLFIRPPYDFAVVDAMLTNFHLPKSTLLVMIEAFVGTRWRDIYDTAIVENYRMLSFGDGMFLSRKE